VNRVAFKLKTSIDNPIIVSALQTGALNSKFKISKFPNKNQTHQTIVAHDLCRVDKKLDILNYRGCVIDAFFTAIRQGFS